VQTFFTRLAIVGVHDSMTFSIA